MQIELQPKSTNMWWRLMRPHTLTASFIPVFTGTAMALLDGQMKFDLFIMMLVASLLIQSATNMLNEYYDYKRGLDNKDSVGIGGTIVRDGVSPNTIKYLAFIFYAISIAIGVYICINSSWWVTVAGLLSIAVSYLYNAGPVPIATTPFGELFSGLFMGPVIIMITYFIQTSSLNWNHFFISLSVGLLIGAINMANNIRDLDGDKEGGRKTLPILLGRPRAINVLAIIFALAFAWIVILVVADRATPWSLMVLFCIPKAVQTIKQFRGKTLAYEMMPAMKSTAQLNTLFGLLLTVSFIIGYVVSLV